MEPVSFQSYIALISYIYIHTLKYNLIESKF